MFSVKTTGQQQCDLNLKAQECVDRQQMPLNKLL